MTGTGRRPAQVRPGVGPRRGGAAGRGTAEGNFFLFLKIEELKGIRGISLRRRWFFPAISSSEMGDR